MSSTSATSRNSEWPLKSALRTLSHLTRAPSRFSGCKSCGTCLLSRPFQSASSPAPHGPLSSRLNCSSFNSVALLSPHCGDVALRRPKRHRKASRRPGFVVDLGADVGPVNKAKLQYSERNHDASKIGGGLGGNALRGKRWHGLRKVLEVHALLLPVSAGAVSAGAAALSSRRRRVSERAPVRALASRRPPVSEPASRPTLRRR